MISNSLAFDKYYLEELCCYKFSCCHDIRINTYIPGMLQKREDDSLIKLKMFLIIGAGGFLGAVMRY